MWKIIGKKENQIFILLEKILIAKFRWNLKAISIVGLYSRLSTS